MKKLTRIVYISLLVLLPATSQAADDWEFTIIPYALFPSIKGESSTGAAEGTDIDVDFGDIIDTLDLGGMIIVEAWHKNRFGVSLGYAFMDLNDETSGPAGFTKAESDIFQGIFEGYLYSRHTTLKGPLDVFAGVRHWDMDIDITLKGINNSEKFNSSDDWVDPIIGARWMPKISDDWSIIARGDIGGFGVGSDFTWNVQAGAVWAFAESMSLVVQYRALSVDYCEGTKGTSGRFCYDTITHGPAIGVAFSL